MAIKHVATLLCDYFIVDQIENKRSYLGEFANITSNKLPVVLPRLVIAINMTGNAGEGYRITLHGPGIKGARDLEEGVIGDVETTSVYAQVLHQVALDLRSVVIPREGVYEVRLWDSATGRVVNRRKFGVFIGQGGP